MKPLRVVRSLTVAARDTPAEDLDLEYARCHTCCGVKGFRHWCSNYVWIRDEAQKAIVQFNWFAGQRRLAPALVAGLWLVILKGRQLGVTWLIAAFCLWRITFNTMVTAVVINQDKVYASDFISKFRFMHERLPDWCRKSITGDSTYELRFAHDGNLGLIRAVATSPTGKAARSMTGDIVVVDEASRVPWLDKTIQAVQPVIGVAGGQLIQLSSSAGPQGIFYDTWAETYGEYGELVPASGVGPSGYKPVFLHWSERFGRDQAWYAQEKERLDKISPIACKQEYPNDPQEAWEYAAGRVYVRFSREQHIGDIEIPTSADRYRAIDWGQTTSPFVCLWIAHVQGAPGLLVSPECPNTIRQMFAWRWDENRPNEPMDVDDDCPDAIRYAIVSFNLTGLVYVYREYYIEEAVSQGMNPLHMLRDIHELSGWEKQPGKRGGGWKPTLRGEKFRGSVADRSWPLLINLFSQHRLPLLPHTPIKGKKGKGTQTDSPRREVLEGIRLVSAMIDGTFAIREMVEVKAPDIALQALREDAALDPAVAVPLERRMLHGQARRLLQARRRRGG